MSNSKIVYSNHLADKKTLLRFRYTNYKDETSDREVIPLQVEYGVTPEHKTPCWLLRSWCMDRKAERSFIMSKMLNVHEVLSGEKETQ